MAYDFRHSFGPGQITGVAIVPGEYFVVDELRNFSISSHFDKVAIRRLGHSLPVGWATGSGTIAGTLIFAQLTRGAFWRIRRYAGTVRVAQGRTLDTPQQEQANINALQSGIRPEQLPPFELMFVHASESGQMAISRLYDVQISDTGGVKGQGNQFPEEQLQYKARWHEQIRLHQSLSTSQMVELANEAGMDKKRGFFNDPRRSNALLDNLMNVSGVDSGDLGEYLIAESEEVENADVPTAMEIADTGDVVFQEQPDDHSDSTNQYDNLREAQRAGRHFAHKIEEIVIVEKDDGSLTTETLTGHLEVDGDELYLSPDIIDDTDNHTPVKEVNLGQPVLFMGPNYYQPLLENSDYGYGDLRFDPSPVSLTITENAVGRDGTLPDIDADTAALPPPGDHEGRGRFTKEVYEVTTSDPVTLKGKALPPGGPSGKETEVGDSGRLFEFTPGPSLEYNHPNLLRTTPLSINAGGGSITKHSDQHWTYSFSTADGGTTVIDCTADAKIKDGDEIELTFTDLDGNTTTNRKSIGEPGPIEMYEAVVEADATYDAAQDQYVFQRLSVSYRTESRSCIPPSTSGTATRITSTWQGRDVDVTVEVDGSYSGTVAGADVSAAGWTELVATGSGVEFKASDEGARIRIASSDDISV